MGTAKPMIALQPWTAQRRARVQALLILILIFGGAFASLLFYISTQKPTASLIVTPPTPNESAMDATDESPVHRPQSPESKPTTPPKYNFYPDMPRHDENTAEAQVSLDPAGTAAQSESSTRSTTATTPTAAGTTPATRPVHPVPPPPTAQPYHSVVMAALEARQQERAASPIPPTHTETHRTTDVSLPPIQLVSIPKSDSKPPTDALSADKSNLPMTPRPDTPVATGSQDTPPSNQPEITSTQPDHHYLLQVGAFRVYAEAERLKTVISALGIQAHIDSSVLELGNVLHRVRIGPFTTIEQTNTVRRHLHANAIATLVIENKP